MYEVTKLINNKKTSLRWLEGISSGAVSTFPR
ncbi:hypothetical protein SAMN05444358_1209 [Ruegeria halocynthiae]|uniref:Uncharacterized protein n=1 Tax=Ruegeria halocynthiae TaxID=985054 RepID=A0A1H3FXH5_9RHOB|nr:hypothetical protein SAMN05444358_1209 [Ruegeria halocynthiae]